MTNQSHHILSLSKKVLAKSGTNVLVASDCKQLKEFISLKTKHYISEISLQRLYGFIPAKFSPSFYTLDVLSKYCGFEDWKAYCENEDKVMIIKLSNQS